MATLIEDVAGLIGRPWRAEDWACWDLCRHVWARHFGHGDVQGFSGDLAEQPRALVTAFRSSAERGRWEAIAAPEHGCGVLMARNDCGRGREIHAGVFLVFDRPMVLHVDKPHGTVADTIAELRATRGWHTLNFYRRK